jgi:hypothetical protein
LIFLDLRRRQSRRKGRKPKRMRRKREVDVLLTDGGPCTENAGDVHPGPRAAQGHGQRSRYAAHRAANTRPAPPTTGSSSLDQGVGRSVWVGISGIRRQGGCLYPTGKQGLYYYDRLERREVASKRSDLPSDEREHGRAHVSYKPCSTTGLQSHGQPHHLTRGILGSPGWGLRRRLQIQ